ncbi:MAG TPA: polyprenyl synthetase family protein [Anaerolineales bacterium]|jgi:geranylgeranyl diphosphate synthase type I
MTDLIDTMRQAIEAELQKQVARLDAPLTRIYHEMLSYHLGWTGEGAGPEATGKRIRPLLVLLVAAACGNSPEAAAQPGWEGALPAAAAVELVHNFSLVHDDIQDYSEKRRGRPTLWVKWGVPQAINAGDGLFVLSNQAITELTGLHPAETALQAAHILHDTCLDLTRGQYLDMSYEKRNDLGVEDYWPMISGKTAALLSCSCGLGALLGNADEATREAYRSFGHYLGLAFQVQDDILGIWGDEAVTGKSAASDLLEGKKSLPILVGLGKNGKFAARWAEGPILPAEVEQVAQLLASEGGYSYTHDLARQMTDMAINSLREANPQGQAGEALMLLADRLLKREA